MALSTPSAFRCEVRHQARAGVGRLSRACEALHRRARALRNLAAPLDGLITPLSDLLSGMAAKDTIPQIEAAVTPEKTLLVFRHLAALSESDLAALREFEAKQGVRIYLQSGGVDTIVPLLGQATPLRYSLVNENLTFEFEPTDFVQINAAVNETLVTRAIDLLQVGPEDRVLDLFCGLGNFTLALARKAAAVVGVEGDAVSSHGLGVTLS